jgi:hypothetical protein
MQEQAPRKSRRRWRWLLGVVGSIGLFVAWKLAWRWYDIHKGTKEYQVAAAELDQSDPAWRWDEIEALRKELPAKENAAEYVLAAGKLLPKKWPDQPAAAPRVGAANGMEQAGGENTPALADRLKDVEPNYQLPEDILAELRAELTALARPLAVARELAEHLKGRYPVVPLAHNPIDTLLPHQPSLRAVINLLHLDAVFRVQEKRGDDACNSVLAILNAGRSAADEPFVVFFLIRASAVRIAVGDVERALGQAELSPAMLRSLATALQREEAESAHTLRVGLRAERAWHDVTLQRIAGGDLLVAEFAGTRKPSLSDKLDSWFAGRRIAASNRALILRHMTELIGLLQLPRDQRRQRVSEIEHDVLSKKGDPEYTFYTTLVPDVAKLFEMRDRELAWLRCARTALAAERYRVTHNGNWPATLQDLGPEVRDSVAIDPFTETPLEMAEEDGVLTISAPGSRGTIDAALFPYRQVQRPGPAVQFRLWKPEKRGLPPDQMP